MMSVGAVERDLLTGGQVSVPVVFIARGAEPGSAKCAFGHTCCLPGGWRSVSATLDTRTRFPSHSKSNHVSEVFPHLVSRAGAFWPLSAAARRRLAGATGRVRRGWYAATLFR